MSYEDTLEVRRPRKHINPGVVTYYKNRVLIHQVGINVHSKHFLHLHANTMYTQRVMPVI
jgi:hypothetical protein